MPVIRLSVLLLLSVWMFRLELTVRLLTLKLLPGGILIGVVFGSTGGLRSMFDFSLNGRHWLMMSIIVKKSVSSLLIFSFFTVSSASWMVKGTVLERAFFG